MGYFHRKHLLRLFISKHIHFACLSFIAAQSLLASSFAEDAGTALEEAVWLKRISEFWKDRDFKGAKIQISTFLEKYKESKATDSLFAMLGDLLFQEEKYDEAKQLYEQVKNQDLVKKIFPRYTHALYANKHYFDLVNLTKKYPEYAEANPVRVLLGQSLFHLAVETDDIGKQRDYAQEAKIQFKLLQGSEHEQLVLLPLAETHKLLKEYERCGLLYIQLAEQHPEKAEDFLLCAAQTQLLSDKKEAAATFGKIAQLKKNHSSDAAYNQLILLFQSEQYRELISAAKDNLSIITQEKQPLIAFYIACAYHSMGNHHEAILSFERYLAGNPSDIDQIKRALTAIVLSSSKIGDGAAFVRALAQFERLFPEDIERAKSLVLHIKFCLKRNEKETAIKELELVLRLFPNLNGRELLFYDYALLLSENKQWERAREIWLNYIDEFPENKHALHAWRHVLNADIQLFQSQILDKNLFAQDLQSILSNDNLLNKEEKRQCRYQLVRLYFDLGKKNEVHREAIQYLQEYKSHISCADIHVRLAFTEELGSNLFFEHAEEALKLNPQLTNSTFLHLQLYNQYLSQSVSDSSKLRKAAEHLYAAYLAKNQIIKNENLQWLADYFYQESQKGDLISSERALGLYEEQINLNIQDASSLDKGSLYIESAALKLSSLYRRRGEYSKEAYLLEKVSEFQENSPQHPWKLRRRVLFDCAKAYEALGKEDEALKNYDYLIYSSTHTPSYLSDAAILQRSKLLYKRLPSEQRSDSDPHVLHILESLKDLQNKKKVISEPIHLEAAIEYAEIRSAISPADNELEQSLFYWNRIKEDFNDTTELQGKGYQEARHQYQDQDLLIQNYLSFVDAEITRIKSLLFKRLGDLENEQQMKQNAVAEFRKLADKKQLLTPYLQEKLILRLERL